MAVKFRRLHNNCENDTQRLSLLDANPALYGAYEIYDASDECNEPRWELEARLLASESFADIAQRLGVEAEVIETYERVFFDVIGRLDAPGVIIHTVIGKAVQMGLAERQYDCLWKLLGYRVGSSVLDAFIYKFNSPSVPMTPDETSAFWNDQTKEFIKKKGFLASVTMPVNWQTQVDILNLWCRMLEMEQNAGMGAAGTEAILDNVQVMMEHLPFIRHRPGVDAEPPGDTTRLEATGVRLRTNELMLIGVNETPKGLEEILSSAKFPKRG